MKKGGADKLSWYSLGLVAIAFGALVVWFIYQNHVRSASISALSVSADTASEGSATTFDLGKKSATSVQENLYFIKSIALKYTSRYDRVVFDFAATNSTPGYTATIKDNVISIQFLDTRDTDANFLSTFTSSKIIRGKGKIISQVNFWYPTDDSRVGAKIYLKSQKGFRVLTKGSQIFVDVECGCGG